MSAVVNNPLQGMHEADNAAFLPWGPEVRIVESYGEVELEYAAIRKGAALMDMPQRAVVILTGKDRRGFLQNKVTNDVSGLTPGKGVYAYLLNLKGRIVMDLNILETEEGMLVEVDRRLAGDFVRDMEKYIFTENVRVADRSEQWGRLTILGPKAGEALGKAMGTGLPGGLLEHVRGVIGGVEVRAVRNDLAGEAQWELMVPREGMVEVWGALIPAGGHEEMQNAKPKSQNSGGGLVRAVGWAAFNMARIEAGTPMYGIDITDNNLPMETAHWYGRAVSVTKGCYVGQEVVARMHAHQTVARMLVGLRVEGEKVPLAGTDIMEAGATGRQDAGGTGGVVGMVTSSCVSPMLGGAVVGMGVVKKAWADAGKEVEVWAEGSRVRARVGTVVQWQHG